jgi:uncharacterized membrane protein
MTIGILLFVSVCLNIILAIVAGFALGQMKKAEAAEKKEAIETTAEIVRGLLPKTKKGE